MTWMTYAEADRALARLVPIERFLGALELPGVRRRLAGAGFGSAEETRGNLLWLAAFEAALDLDSGACNGATERALWTWYREWSSVADVVVVQRWARRRLGLAAERAERGSA